MLHVPALQASFSNCHIVESQSDSHLCSIMHTPQVQYNNEICSMLECCELVLQGKQKMSEDDMEQLMDALEKMHHTELQKHPERWANLIGSPLPAK